jgi:hypothetical protein
MEIVQNMIFFEFGRKCIVQSLLIINPTSNIVSYAKENTVDDKQELHEVVQRI